MDRPATAASLTRRRLWRWAKSLYAVAVIAFLGWSLGTAWPNLREWNALAISPGIAASVGGWLMMVLLLGAGWASCLTAWSGVALPARQWIPMQAAAWVGRYLPGKIGLLAGKLKACECGASWKQVTGSVICEQLAFVATGIAIAGLALPLLTPLLPSTGRLPTAVVLALLLFPMTALLAWPWVAPRHGPSSRGWSLRLAGWSTLAHIAAGLGFHGLLLAIMPTAPTWTVSIGLLAAGHVAGTLAVFAPAGLGVREAVIASALSPYVGWPQAIAITALQRSLTVASDGLVALAGAMFQWRRKG